MSDENVNQSGAAPIESTNSTGVATDAAAPEAVGTPTGEPPVEFKDGQAVSPEAPAPEGV